MTEKEGTDTKHSTVDKKDNVAWRPVSCEQWHQLCFDNILCEPTEMILVDWVQV